MAIVIALASANAGHGASAEKLDAFQAALKRRGFGLVIAHSEQELIEAIEVMVPDALVAAGGDGTVNRLIQFQWQTPLLRTCPIGVLPLGNENLVAKALSTPQDPSFLADAIRQQRTAAFDVGIFEYTKPFVLMLSIGIDADVVHAFDQWRHETTPARRSSRRAYLKHVMTQWKKPSERVIQIQTQGVSYSGHWLYIANLPQYAAGARPCPTARADDAQLDWVLLPRLTRWGMFCAAWKLWRGKLHTVPGVQYGHAEQMRVSTSDGTIPFQYDGDPATSEGILNIGVRGNAIRFFLPYDGAD